MDACVPHPLKKKDKDFRGIKERTAMIKTSPLELFK